ncbi:nitroreductase [Haloferula luteola]|uniref:Nitroreductase n=1 Tax=Haloferula luteola TaxID=595692 RepID=A0A840V5L3_9BACT|nr:NAD(P)H-dependent oxidoreductase [Haloferula luteola]MBB5350078.1 nitroreductase [Haloferula luteola]
MSPDELVQSLQWRYATKHFDASKPIAEDVLDALHQSLVLTPSSFGLQPWKFFIVRDPELKEKLKTASWNQPQLTQAQEIVVFAARVELGQQDIDRWIDCLGEAQNQPREALAPLVGMIEGFVHRMSPGEQHAWNSKQCYIALGQFMAAAAALGVDACPLEGIDPAAYDVILDLGATGYATCMACAIGYRSSTDHTANRPKARFPLNEVVEIR